MRRLIFGALGLLLLFALGFLLLERSDPAEAAAADAVSSESAAPAAAPAAALAAETAPETGRAGAAFPAEGRVELPRELEPRITVRGRLVTRDGRPVAGGTLSAFSAGGFLGEDPAFLAEFFRAIHGQAAGDHRREERVTGPDGRAELSLPAGGDSLAVTGRAEGYSSTTATLTLVAGQSHYDAGELVLEPGIALQVLVQDEQGQAVEGAAVIVSGKLEEAALRPVLEVLYSDAAGTCRFPHLSASVQKLNARAPGYVSVEEALGAVEAGTTVERRLMLRRGGALTGTVLEADGSPAAGVPIFVKEHGASSYAQEMADWFLAGSPWAQSDARGRFTVSGLQEGRSYAVRAQRDEHLAATVEPAAAGADLTLRLPALFEISGRLLTAAGTPAAAARLAFFDAGEPALDYAERIATTTGADGRFQLGLRPGEYRVAAWHDSGEGLLLDQVRVEGLAQLGDLKLAAGGTLELRVTQAGGGGPIRGAEVVEARPPPGTKARGDWRWNAILSSGRGEIEEVADGLYRWKGLAAGPHRFEVAVLDFAAVIFEVEILPGQTVTRTVELESAAILNVLARLPNGEPAAKVLLSVARQDGAAQDRRMESDWTDGEGRARFAGLRPGNYRIAEGIYHPDFSGERQALLEVAVNSGENHVEVLLPPVHDLLVRVTDGLGPVAGAVVSAAVARPVAARPAAPGASSQETNAGGQVVLSGLRAGSHRLSIRRPNGHPKEVMVEIPAPGGAVEVRLEGLSLAGRVQNAPAETRVTVQSVSAPAAGAWSLTQESGAGALERRISGAGSAIQASVSCDAGGRFAVHDLPPGTYELRAQASGCYCPAPLVVTLENVAVDGLTLRLERAGRLNFSASGLSPAATLARVRVLLPGGEEAARLSVSRDGSYSVPDLAPGSYEVRVEVFRDGRYQSSATYAVTLSADHDALVEWRAP